MSEFANIDNIYIELIELERMKSLIIQNNKIYNYLALLLQILGLGFLILRKDFSIF
ncbi:MAG: hypothetical protein ISQ32_00400 [Rickettsiales bacterium]|nr:hypothetical protein [Rickettsiales bacterium]